MSVPKLVQMAARLTIAACLTLLVGIRPGIAAADLSSIFQFNIAPQQLPAALLKYSQQSGVLVTSPAELVDGKATSGVVGTFSARRALDQLLQGSALAYEVIGSNTISIVARAPDGRGVTASPGTDSSPGAAPSAPISDPEKGAQKKQQSFWGRFRVAEVNEGEAAGHGSEASSSANSQQSASEKLEEIVVTAQKRAERLQDVPSSISVLSGLDIERKGVVGMDDFMRGVPGAYRMETGAGRKNPIVIRGLSAQPDTADAAVGVYFGEVPLQSSLTGNDWFGSADLSLVDMQRVEVLKGPQGTLYGSGSLAGIVREQPAEPDLQQLSAKVTAGYSNTGKNGSNNYLGNGVVNLPLVQDKFAVRLVGYRSSDSGYVKNVAASGGAGRAPFLIQSGQLGGALVDEDRVGQVDRTGARLTALWRPVDAFKASYMLVRQEMKLDGAPEVNLPLGTYEQAFMQVRRAPRGAGQDSTATVHNLVLNYDFSRAQLMSSTSHIKTDSAFVRDVSQAGLGPISQLAHGMFTEFSEEVRLTSKLDGPFQYLVGGFYEDSKVVEQIGGPGGGIAWWEGDLNQFANLFPNAAQPQTDALLPIFIESFGTRRDVEQRSFFGEMSYEFLQGLKATLGARHFSYTKSSSALTLYIPAYGLLDRNDLTELSSDESGNVFKASLAYKPSPDGLLYGQWSQGFRVGTPLDKPTPICDPDGDGIETIVTVDGRQVTQGRSLESDRTDNFEIGGKFSMLENRANIHASLFLIDWDKIPITVVNVNAVCTASVNAGKARSQGVELETDFLLGAGLSAHLGASYVKAELTADAGALGSKGDRLPGSPRFSGNAALNYDFSWRGHEAYARGDVVYVGTFYNNLQQIGTAAGGYYQLNLRSGVAYGPVNLDFYIKNVTNDDGLTWVYAALPLDGRAYRLRPRTVGMQLMWSF